MSLFLIIFFTGNRNTESVASCNKIFLATYPIYSTVLFGGENATEKESIPKVCCGNSVPTTDFVKYTFRRSVWFTTLNIKCAATALIEV